MQKPMHYILRFIKGLFFETISELEKSGLLLEKKYADLVKKEEENRKLHQQLKQTNIHLKKELRQKEEELKILYCRTSGAEDEKHLGDIRRMEKEIAGGFSHRLKNLYAPVVLFNDKIHRTRLLSRNRDILQELIPLVKNAPPAEDPVSLIKEISRNNQTLEEIFHLSKCAIDRNLKIIDAFLNYAEISRSAALEKVFINRVLEQVIRVHREVLELNRVTLIQDLKSRDPVMADYSHIFLLFQNLLMNAVKAFRKKSPPNQKNTIIIRTRIPRENKNSIVVEIIDNGTGIEENNMEKLFKPFFTTDRQQGTGLGLSLCKRIVEMYNGSITVKSRFGSGASFRVILPREKKS